MRLTQQLRNRITAAFGSPESLQFQHWSILNAERFRNRPAFFDIGKTLLSAHAMVCALVKYQF